MFTNITLIKVLKMVLHFLSADFVIELVVKIEECGWRSGRKEIRHQLERPVWRTKLLQK